MHPSSPKSSDDLCSDPDISLDYQIDPDLLLQEDKTTRFTVFLTFVTAFSGLLFGLDTGIISGALVSIKSDLGHPLSDLEKELITSATTLGALIGAILAGIWPESIGRRVPLQIADVFFTMAAIIQAVAHDVGTLTGGRFIIGLGVGIASGMAPLFLGEIAPTRLRGRLVVINVLCITGGQVLAYGIGAAFFNVHSGWRYMFGLCGIPSLIQGISMHFLPESPRFLVLRDRKDEALNSLRRIYGDTASEIALVAKLDVIVRDLEEQQEWSVLSRKGWAGLLKGGNGRHRRAVIVASMLQGLQQLCGFNTLMYYSATLFATIGFDHPTAVGLIVSGTNFVFTLVALVYIDRLGRRRILLWTVPGMVIGLVMAAMCFHYLTLHTGGILEEGREYSNSWSSGVLACMIFYVASYALGIGNIPWQQGELFSTAFRKISTGISTACNWSGNLIISSTYLSLMRAITPTGAFGLYGAICFVGWIAVYFIYPETKGLSLEETNALFAEDFGIRKSELIRHQKGDVA